MTAFDRLSHLLSVRAKTHRSKLAKLAGPLGVRGLAIGLTFIQSVILVRLFGPEVYGAFSFAISIGALLLLFVSFGFDNLLIRELASIKPEGALHSKRWNHITSFSGKVVAALTLLSVAGMIAAALFWADGTIYQWPLVITAFALPFVTMRKFVEALAVGAKQIIRSMWGTQVVFPTLMVALSLAAIGLAFERSAVNLSYIYVAASLLSLLAALLILRGPALRSGRAFFLPFAKSSGRPTSEPIPSRRSLTYAGANLALVAGALMMGQHLDVIMTGMFASSSEVAIVRVCSRIAEIIGIVRMVLILQYKPVIAEDFARGDQAELQKHVKQLMALFVMTGVPIFLFIFVVAEPILSIFGAEFVESVWVLRIYMLAILASIMAGPVTTVLSMCGGERQAALGLWAAVAVNFVGNLFLIPWLGPIGAATSNLLSMIALGIICSILARRTIGVSTSVLQLLPRRRAKS